MTFLRSAILSISTFIRSSASSAPEDDARVKNEECQRKFKNEMILKKMFLRTVRSSGGGGLASVLLLT